MRGRGERLRRSRPAVSDVRLGVDSCPAAIGLRDAEDRRQRLVVHLHQCRGARGTPSATRRPPARRAGRGRGPRRAANSGSSWRAVPTLFWPGDVLRHQDRRDARRGRAPSPRRGDVMRAWACGEHDGPGLQHGPALGGVVHVQGAAGDVAPAALVRQRAGGIRRRGTSPPSRSPASPSCADAPLPARRTSPTGSRPGRGGRRRFRARRRWAGTPRAALRGHASARVLEASCPRGPPPPRAPGAVASATPP